METALLTLTFGSFLIFWIVTILFYTPACFELKNMMVSIDTKGKLPQKAPTSSSISHFHTIHCWTISLPTSEKYLKFEELQKITKRLRTYLKFMAYTATVMISCGFILLMTVS